MEKSKRHLTSEEALLMAPNICILKLTRLIIPEKKLEKVIAIVIHEIITFFVLTQFIDLFMSINLDMALTNLKTTMFSGICVFKSNSILIWQESWISIINYVTKSHNIERRTANPRRQQIINSITKYCHRMTKMYWVLVMITAFTTISGPLIKYLTFKSLREDIHNGVEPFPHIVNSWMPVDKDKSPGCWITMVWQVIICSCGTTLVMSYDACAIVLMVYFGGQQDLLRDRCKELFGQSGIGVDDNEFYVKLREIHHIHILHVKYTRLFNSVLSPVMFVYIVICSVMLCASAYQITKATDTSQVLFLSNYLVFGIAQLLIFCWHSNDALTKNEDLPYGLYESGWWAANIKQRKAIMILKEQLKTKQVFSAGPFTSLTLSTFVTTLKGAYSYWTLIKK
ncbi:hypothetical protein ACJJTC_002565 [Scirpophaga incertulas]